MKQIYLLVVTTVALSCNQDKKYSYIETVKQQGIYSTGNKEEEVKTIYAPNDSTAYIEAYQKFCISQKVQADMIKTLGSSSSIPLSFKLVDKDGRDITYTTLFAGKDSIEKALKDQIFSMANSLEEAADTTKAIRIYDPMPPTIDSAAIKNLLPYFTVKTDEFDSEGKKWYTPKSAPKFVNTNAIYCYFQVTNGVATNFRFRIQYYADDWLFFKKCQFSIDGKAFDYYPLDVETDSGNGGYIWEWSDETVTSSDIELIQALANAKQAKIKFIGDQYHNIKTISANQILNIKRALDLYKALGGVL